MSQREGKEFFPMEFFTTHVFPISYGNIHDFHRFQGGIITMEENAILVEEKGLHRLMTKKEMVPFLCGSPRHVDNLKAFAGLPFQKLGNLIRFDVQAVMKWLKQQEK